MNGISILRAGNRVVLIKDGEGKIHLTVGFSQEREIEEVPRGMELELGGRQAQTLAQALRDADKIAEGSFSQTIHLPRSTAGTEVWISIERSEPRTPIRLTFKGYTAGIGERTFWVDTYANQAIRHVAAPIERAIAPYLGQWYQTVWQDDEITAVAYERLHHSLAPRSVSRLIRSEGPVLLIYTMLEDLSAWLNEFLARDMSSYSPEVLVGINVATEPPNIN